MTESQFSTQMNRVISTYGKIHYPPERLALIWREVGTLTENAFSRIVERLIGDYRQPPLLPEIREMVSKVREQEWHREKSEHRKEAESFWSDLPTEDMRGIAEMIRKRIGGEVDDATYEKFVSHLRHAFADR